MSSAREIIEEFNRYKHYACSGDCLFIKKLRDGGLSEEHMAVVIEAIDSTCSECMDAPAGCQCWNDE